MFEFHISLSDLSSIAANWINVILSAVTLCLAIYAISSWKKEKVYDIDTNALAMIGKLHLAILNNLDTYVDLKNLTLHQREDYDINFRTDELNAWLVATYYCYQNKVENFKEVNSQLAEVAIKVMRHSTDKELIALYKYYYVLQAPLTANILAYYIDCGRQRLSEIGELGDVAYNLSDDDFNRINRLISEDFKSIREELFHLTALVNNKFLNRIV